MKSKFQTLFVVIGIAVVLAWFFSFPKKEESQRVAIHQPLAKKTSTSSMPMQLPDSQVAATANKTANKTASRNEKVAQIMKKIEAAWMALSSGSAAEKKQALDELDEILAGKDHDAVAGVAAIMDFLKTGKNASTGELFSVGPKGVLSTSPTLRVMLMDQLGSLSSEAQSTAAVDSARSILQTQGSADEWAVSMRNLAWLDPNSGDLLKQKAAEMLTNDSWAANPSTGMLEAFDVMVHTSATEMIPTLASLVGQTDSPLSRASSVALDRLAEQHPVETASYLLANPSVMNDLPQVRADLFSKSNLNDPQQRQLLETYLGTSSITVDEKTKSLNSLTAPGSFISNNLLTPPPHRWMPPVKPQGLAC